PLTQRVRAHRFEVGGVDNGEVARFLIGYVDAIRAASLFRGFLGGGGGLGRGLGTARKPEGKGDRERSDGFAHNTYIFAEEGPCSPKRLRKTGGRRKKPEQPGCAGNNWNRCFSREVFPGRPPYSSACLWVTSALRRPQPAKGRLARCESR